MPEDNSNVKQVGVSRQHQLTEECLSQDSQDLSDISLPFTVEDVTLMSPGVWNDKEYREQELRQAYNRTDFNDPEVVSLFNEHDDEDSRDWIGEVKNIRMNGQDMVGDVEIVTADEARKLAYGARFGISPKVTGMDQGDVIRNYEYDNFSLVLDPAVKTTYMNSEKQSTDEEQKQGVKNVKVKHTMTEDQTEELSDEELQKIEEVAQTVENSDVEELANVVAPFVGREAEEVQPAVEEVMSGHDEDEDEEMEEEEEYEDHDEEEMRDMEEIASRVIEGISQEIREMQEDEGGDGDGAESESLSVDKVAEKVADEISIENSEDEDEDTEEDEAVEALKEEVKELKTQLTEENQEENKTPNPGSQATGASEELSAQEKVQQMDAEELDKGAAKYLLRKQGRRLG